MSFWQLKLLRFHRLRKLQLALLQIHKRKPHLALLYLHRQQRSNKPKIILLEAAPILGAFFITLATKPSFALGFLI
jgi:hypothetical protein